MALLISPAIGVPLLSMNTAQATVLGLRGVIHPGTVTGVRVSHGKTTTYSCAVRYADVPGRGGSVECGAGDSVGEQVSVTEDPGGLVDPEFTAAATGGRFDLSLVGLSDATLVVVASSVAGLGAALHLVRTRRIHHTRRSRRNRLPGEPGTDDHLGMEPLERPQPAQSPPSPQPVIALDGLTLRRFAGEADLPELFRVIEESLEHLRPWMPWVAEHSRAMTTEYLAARPEQWASGRDHAYAIVLDGAIVGACGLYRREDTPDDVREIGYWLHPAATGRGLATRATAALVDQAFQLPGVEYVDIVHDAANRASGAVPARLGFTEHLRRPREVAAPAESGEELVWRLSRAQARASTR